MLTISAIPAYSDNYIWAIQHSHHQSAYIVDPGDSSPVEQFLRTNQLELAGILVTHRHWDHITGIDALTASHQVTIVGPACEAIPQITQAVREGDSFLLWNDIPVTVLETPGHMPEHVSYFMEDNGKLCLFCGDTLFSAGCGRIFSGSHDELKSSLDKLKNLPPATEIYCAHEYTLANLRFAAAVEGETDAICQRRIEVDTALKNHQPSLPSTLDAEVRFNPFLRCGEPAVITAAERYAHRQLSAESDVFAVLREWKNTF